MSILKAITSVPFEFHIGDPTLIGWVTVGTYLVAALLCLLCAVYAKQIFQSDNSRWHALIWVGLGLLLLLLGINKQLDVQSWFTAVIKAIAWEQGWYEFGQRAQVYFLAGFGLLGLVVLAGLGWIVRHHWRRYILLILGFLFILRFIFVRIGTFYGISLPELSALQGVRINWLLELVGIIVIALSALNNIRYRSHSPTAISHS